MQHIDQEALAMLALGEPPASGVSEHLLDCPECARELAALRHVVTVARSADPADAELKPPPEAVWNGIAAELGVSAGPDPLRAVPFVSPDTEGHGEGGPSVPGATEDGASPKAVVPLANGAAGRRAPSGSRRFWLVVAACAALLGGVAGSGITWWSTDRNQAAAEAGPALRLDPLLATAAGVASLGENDGRRQLDITVRGLPKTSGYFEVWLMDRSHTKLISMGVLGADGHAALPVPDNVNLDEYALVDVSVQPYNGKPDHSGNSVVRGPYAG
ncbi:anti-sigma factor [Streptomyces sp. NPDC005574]|uniref:anti-sigma factor n=1 Tax=Streptomyces sp. NPDC005574 TaxID=3156891 RepID=UPI0033ABC962